MPPRRRSSAHRGYPPNTYERDGYFSWRNPITGKEYGLGREKVSAFSQAIEANLYIAQHLNKPRLLDHLTGEADRSVPAWVAKYQERLARRNPPLSANTLKSYKSLGKRTAATWPGLPVKSLTPLMVSTELENLQHIPRLAQAWCNFMRECFRDAIVAGWLDENPVREVRAARVVVQRSRLTLEVWQKVYDAAEQPWLRNAMLLALLSAQRREDLVLATVTDVRDGLWFVDQGKTGAKIALSLSLRLNCLGMSLGDAYKQCRGTGVLSRFLIHQTEPRGNSPIGSAIWKDTLSRRFTDTLIGLKLDFEGKNPPTFHEIRSLSERLYAAQGDVNTQDLLGHKDPRSTAVYHELRGVEWLKVEAR